MKLKYRYMFMKAKIFNACNKKIHVTLIGLVNNQYAILKFAI